MSCSFYDAGPEFEIGFFILDLIVITNLFAFSLFKFDDENSLKCSIDHHIKEY